MRGKRVVTICMIYVWHLSLLHALLRIEVNLELKYRVAKCKLSWSIEPVAIIH